jgi:HSP20 family protein
LEQETIVLESLKQAGRNIEREIGRAWESLSEGWRELLSRSSSALTRFHYAREKVKTQEGDMEFPRWSLLAGEIEESADEVVVRVELPGIKKTDCQVTIEDNLLRISGEKQAERITNDSTYHMMERAYGAFQRTFSLPRDVDAEQAQASYQDGVLTVRMPRIASRKGKSLTIS